MNKAEFINKMQSLTGDENSQWTKVQCAKAVECFTQAVIDALSSGEKVSLVGFGTFEVVETKEKTGVNPKTKEKIIIPASKRPKFKVGKILRDGVKGV